MSLKYAATGPLPPIIHHERTYWLHYHILGFYLWQPSVPLDECRLEPSSLDF